MKQRKPFLFLILVGLSLLVLSPIRTHAQGAEFSPTDLPANVDEITTVYSRGEVIDVSEDTQTIAGQTITTQKLKVKITSGEEKGKEVTTQFGGLFSSSDQKMKKGDRVAISKVTANGQDQYSVADHYRLPAIFGLVALFVVAILIFGRWRGATSLLGLGISIVVIIQFLIPQILSGKNPLLFSIITAIFLAVITLYLAHGFKKRTTASVISTVGTLLLASGMSVVAVYLTHLFGRGTNETFSLQFTSGAAVDLRGLLMGGMIIGTLGILDDITIGQAAALDELKKANPKFTFRDLVKRGISLGQEHIASLVNTLVLVYAGASLSLLLLLKVGASEPLWLIVNSEYFAEEIVRTLIGSLTLIFAVPIATFVSAYIFTREKSQKS